MQTNVYKLLGLAACGVAVGAAAVWAYDMEQKRLARHRDEPKETPGMDAECEPIQSPRPRSHVKGNATL